jgi:hypothetical protein
MKKLILYMPYRIRRLFPPKKFTELNKLRKKELKELRRKKK